MPLDPVRDSVDTLAGLILQNSYLSDQQAERLARYWLAVIEEDMLELDDDPF